MVKQKLIDKILQFELLSKKCRSTVYKLSFARCTQGGRLKNYYENTVNCIYYVLFPIFLIISLYGYSQSDNKRCPFSNLYN